MIHKCPGQEGILDDWYEKYASKWRFLDAHSVEIEQ